MSKEIAKKANGNLVPVSKDSSAEMAALAGPSSYLPRIQLMTDASEPVKEDIFPKDHFALILDQEHTDLGAEVDLIVCGYRPKALELGEEVINVYDMKLVDGMATGEFKRIMEMSEQADSGCMYGPEYLVYIPDHGFATFFFGNKSLRRESKKMQAYMGKAVTAKAQLIKTKKYKYKSVAIALATREITDVPSESTFNEVSHKFLNPSSSEVERVEETKATTRER